MLQCWSSQMNNLRNVGVTAALALLLGVFPTHSLAVAPPEPAGCPATTTTVDSEDANLPIAITDNATFMSTLTVTGLDARIWDVDLTAFITHTFPGDLDITLTSPAGTVITITTDNGGTADDAFNGTVWDDDAGDVNPPGGATDATYVSGEVEASLAPEEALAAFIGEDPNGDWILEISDDAGANTGSLDAWSLTITTILDDPENQTSDINSDDAALPIAIVDNATQMSTLTVADLDNFICDIDLTTFITHTFSGDLDITLTSPAGTVVTITTDNAGTNNDVFNGTVWDDDAGDTNPPVIDTGFIGGLILLLSPSVNR